jgi:hypothetical protein
MLTETFCLTRCAIDYIIMAWLGKNDLIAGTLFTVSPTL